MYAIFEVNHQDVASKGNDSIIRIDSSIQSLSWMSKTNLLNLPPGSDLSSAKTNCYQEGWLATGNTNFMVGCTFTTCLSEQQYESIKTPSNQLETKPQTTTASDQPSTSQSSTGSSTSNQTNSLNRTNFNLRGHKSDIKLVRWNEPYQKLASCDSKGVIYVWVKYEGRWSIELINDRGNCVTDFAWSHDGRQAVICYQDGFVLVGSVNGQRYWSNLYDLSNAVITSATWTPNDAFILLGLSNGNLMIVDENGTIVSRHHIKDDSILNLAYNSPKFFLNELIETHKSSTQEPLARPNSSQIRFRHSITNNFNFSPNQNSVPQAPASAPAAAKLKSKINNNDYILACSFKSSGLIYLMKSYDNYLDPVVIDTKLEGVKFEWTLCGKILAVGGYEIQKSKDSKSINPICLNYILFYSQQGSLMYKIEIPSLYNSDISNKNSIIDKLELKQKKYAQEQQQQQQQQETNLANKSNELKHLTALTWAHNDQRLFVACSNQLHILRVYKQIPTLSLLAQHRIKTNLNDRKHVTSFCLPERLKQKLGYCFSSTLKMSYPKLNQLRKFVCTCSPHTERLHCTLKRMNLKSNHDYYILYLEYLGGLVPLLSAKKVSKLKPDFVIFDPFLSSKKEKKNLNELDPSETSSSIGSSLSSSLDSLYSQIDSEPCTEDLMRRTQKKSKKKRKLNISKRSRFNTNRFSHKVKDNSFDINNTKHLVTTKYKKQKSNKNKFKNNYLVQVDSNFWGTKFKFHGHNYLPSLIGQIVYKTSLFHLQPRQMTITLEDLTYLSKLSFTSKKVSKTSVDKESIKKPPTSPQLKNFFNDLNNLNSILGAIPQNLNTRTSLTSSCSSLYDQANSSDYNLVNKIQISTAQQLIESKFRKEDEIVDLPVLKLAKNDSVQVYNDLEENREINCLITSATSACEPLITQKKSMLTRSSSRKTTILSKLNADLFLNYLKNRKNFDFYSMDKPKHFEKSFMHSVERNTEEICVDEEEELLVRKEKAKVKRASASKGNQFVLHNKPPIWNETSQVYQLDFGGRVTQESAKNFQVEFQGKQVMQFGRIDTNAYTLDFEWPFTTVQAFSIALANITQRLK